MTSKSEVHEFVQRLLRQNGDEGPLADKDSLLISGRLQSVDAIEIVIFLEERFGIDFAELGFDRDQIDSIDAIFALVLANSKA